jgi:hypothetical protein
VLTIHASRSRYEAFLRCPRYGYLQFHWGGRGIVKQGKNIFLSTGIWLHHGLELVGKWCKKHNKIPYPDIIHDIVTECRQGYFDELFKNGGTGFDLRDEIKDEFTGEIRELSEHEMRLKQQYTFDEQSALVEALIRLFVMRVLPDWLKRYKIVAVELDMAFPIVKLFKAGEWIGFCRKLRLRICTLLTLRGIELLTEILLKQQVMILKDYPNLGFLMSTYEVSQLTNGLWVLRCYISSKELERRLKEEMETGSKQAHLFGDIGN